MLQAAEAVLKRYDNAGGMRDREITDLAREDGLLTSRSRTPHASMSARLAVDVKRNPNTKFMRTAPGRYALRERGANGNGSERGDHLASRVAASGSESVTEMNHVDAAVEVLRRHAGRDSMHYREIARLALEDGLIQSVGRTPEESVRSRIGQEIARSPESSRFRKTGRGQYALRRSPDGIGDTAQGTSRGRAEGVPPVIRPISATGQLSLPPEVRRRWAVGNVLLVDKEAYVIVYPMPDDPIAALRGSLAGVGDEMTTDEMRQLGREEDADDELDRQRSRA